jgi:hypothetical protein
MSFDDLTRLGFDALNKLVAPLVKRGIGSPLRLGFGAVVLETTGRRSGAQREVPLLAGRVGDTVIVSTVRERSAWVDNLDAAPLAAVWLNGRARPATARIRRLPGLRVALLQLSGATSPR